MVKKKKGDNTLGILSHLLGLFTGFVGPLIMFFAAEDKEAKKHSKFALNWQFSLLIYSFVSVLLMVIIIGIVFLVALGILNMVFCIMATVKASEGKYWKYPLTIPFFKVKV
jgi:uncharacterized protein